MSISNQLGVVRDLAWLLNWYAKGSFVRHAAGTRKLIKVSLRVLRSYKVEKGCRIKFFGVFKVAVGPRDVLLE